MFSAAHLKILTLAAFALFAGVVTYVVRHDLKALRGEDDERDHGRSLQTGYYSPSTVPTGGWYYPTTPNPARRPTGRPAASSRYPTYGGGITITTPAPASPGRGDGPSAIIVPGGGGGGGGDAPTPGGGGSGGRPGSSVVPAPVPVPVPVPIEGGASAEGQSSSNTVAIIVGVVVAGAVAIALIVAGIVVWSKKRSASTQPGGGGVHPAIQDNNLQGGGNVQANNTPSVPPPIGIPVASAVPVQPESEKVRAELEEQSPPAKNPNSVVSKNTETTIGQDGSRNVVTTTVWADGRKQVETKSYPGKSA